MDQRKLRALVLDHLDFYGYHKTLGLLKASSAAEDMKPDPEDVLPSETCGTSATPSE